MRALAVKPGDASSAGIIEVPDPKPANGNLLVRAIAVGICGTDAEIVRDGYGQPPADEEYLIIGHESLGEVLEAPQGCGFTRGQLVVGMVRRPDPEPCSYCGRGELDMCRNGLYRERGINHLHGYASELFELEPEFAVPVAAELGDLAVLVEPASVVAKAGDHALHILRRESMAVRVALVTGAGPIGLLATMMLCKNGIETHVVDVVDGGPKPDLVRRIGGTYHACSPRDLAIEPELIIECTGIGKVAAAAGAISAPGAVMALTGIASDSQTFEADFNAMNRRLVLGNRGESHGQRHCNRRKVFFRSHWSCSFGMSRRVSGFRWMWSYGY